MNCNLVTAESMPGIWYQLKVWAEKCNQTKCKTYVFQYEDEAVNAYHSTKNKVQQVVSQHSDIKAGCVLDVYVDGEYDLMKTYDLFCRKLYEEDALILNK